jgi:superfamily I DNA/RNA helicase/RecB family exonuclease
MEQRAVIEHAGGRLTVMAGPGTGKTTTLVEAIANRIEVRGVAPSSLLVLTFSRRAAADLSMRVAARLKATTTEPIVRTLHSFAYALVRAAAARAEEPQPRLLDAGQADLMVRDILAGHAEDGGRYWPRGLRAALRVPAFAAELRELMLRAAERQLSPRRIAALGQRHARPEWTAVARFIEEYRQIGDLRQGTTGLGAKLDQAELTTAALESLADPVALADLRSRVRHVFVDEYQDVDPAQAALVDLVASGADELVVVGDPDQSIYAFRGAEAGAMTRIETDDVVSFTVSRRLAPALIDATRRVAARIPGPQRHRGLRAVAPSDDGDLEIRVLATASQEASLIADRLRRLHAESGVAYSAMAVLMRSPSTGGDVIRRALTAAGVPVAYGSTAPAVEDPLVASLLALLRAGVTPDSLDGDAAMAVLASPLGEMDVVEARRLRRAVRAATPAGDGTSRTPSADLVAEILHGRRELPPGLADDVAARVRHVAGLVAIATDGRDEPAAETVLWRLWQASGLAGRLAAACERDGDQARRAEGHLDAVMTLFERAGDVATQLPSAGVRGLIDLVAGEKVAASPMFPATGEAVVILSAHAAKGLEWDAVAVAGVQDDVWPDLRPRTSLLRFGELFDAAEGIDPGVPAPSRLADERRLFYVAVTRARTHLIVTAVENRETTPSRFLHELADDDAVHIGWPTDGAGRPRRTLTLPSLVAELRAAVCAEGDDPADAGDGSRAARAARALATLTGAGVRGADPDTWYGLAEQSTERSLTADGDTVTLSPSQVESLMECPLRTVLGRHGGRPEPGQSQLVGMAVHALAEGMAVGATPDDVDAAIEEFLTGQTRLPHWEVAGLRRRMQAMRRALETWLAAHSGTRSFLASELQIDVAVPGDGGHPLQLRGRIDWLSRDANGRVVVTDFKTGSTMPSIADGQAHPQLAVYQLAVALGALAGHVGADTLELGGAELVYLADGTPRTRWQDPQSQESEREWIGRLNDLAGDSTGPAYVARAGEYCSRCPVRSSCPLQPEGRQVTR